MRRSFEIPVDQVLGRMAAPGAGEEPLLDELS